MANLLVDIGNTAVKACTADSMTLGRTYRYQGEHAIDFVLGLVDKIRPAHTVLSCAYRLSLTDADVLRQACGDILILDGSDTSLQEEKGFPTYLTCDRVASLLAAKYLFKGHGAVVVDFGTTLTVDFLDEIGQYEGGNVSIGLRTRFKALNRYSKALPLVPAPEEVQPLGTSFTTSVESGAVMGIMFEIDGYLGIHPSSMVVFTGGDAIYFAKRMEKPIFVVCNLVLMGLALIADEHVEKIS